MGGAGDTTGCGFGVAFLSIQSSIFSRFGSPDHSFIILPYMAGQTVSVGGQKEENLLRLKNRLEGAEEKLGSPVNALAPELGKFGDFGFFALFSGIA